VVGRGCLDALPLMGAVHTRKVVMQQTRKRFTESANTSALRGLMIGLAALVVLSVSGYGTVIYIQLMGKVFPSGPLLMACYMGAAANVLLMLILLVGKFVWFRTGAHEVA